MITIKLTEYWAKEQLLADLARVKSQGRNSCTMLSLDIDLCDSAETDLLLSEIERQFAYLEAGLIEQARLAPFYLIPAHK